MTEERAKKIIEAIETYGDNEKLFAMSPEEAVEALNANGNDFTLEEIVEAGEGLKTVSQVTSANGEIDIDVLEKVSGGANSSFWAGVAVGSGTGAAVCFAGAAICACCW